MKPFPTSTIEYRMLDAPRFQQKMLNLIGRLCDKGAITQSEANLLEVFADRALHDNWENLVGCVDCGVALFKDRACVVTEEWGRGSTKHYYCQAHKKPYDLKKITHNMAGIEVSVEFFKDGPCRVDVNGTKICSVAEIEKDSKKKEG